MPFLSLNVKTVFVELRYVIHCLGKCFAGLLLVMLFCDIVVTVLTNF